MSSASIVCVVDDDAAVAGLASAVLESAGFVTRRYASAEDLLEQFDEQEIQCVVTDHLMPGMTGGQLIQQLRDLRTIVSVVILSGHVDVRTAVRLMEGGAFTLLEKPYQPGELIDVVRRAVAQTKSRRIRHIAHQQTLNRLNQLTDDEQSVLKHMISGLPNKTIASRLGISSRTLDRRRRAVLHKMGVRSVSELVQIVTRASTAERMESSESDST